MNLRQLEYFVAIAEEHQLTAAAKRLHITQPPLSYELGQLERELGVTLVRRGPRRADLTDAGKLLYTRASQILAMVGAATHEVQSFDKGMSGVLHVGVISSSTGFVPGSALTEFANTYPQVQFELHEGNTYELLDKLERGIVDVCVVRTPFVSQDLACRPIAQEPMVAVMPPSFVCGENPARVTLAELAGKPLVAYRRFEKVLQDAFAKDDVESFFACMADDARTACVWSSCGMGIGLVPQSILSVIDVKEHTIIKEVASEQLVTSLVLVWRKDRYLSPLATRFVRLIAGTNNESHDEHQL